MWDDVLTVVLSYYVVEYNIYFAPKILYAPVMLIMLLFIR